MNLSEKDVHEDQSSTVISLSSDSDVEDASCNI